MTGIDQEKKITLQLTWADYGSKNLAARVAEFKRRNTYIELDDRVAAIQFLRGASARASHLLPALYLVLGAGSRSRETEGGHWKAVQGAILEETALQSIALACRAIFDDSRKQGRLSGKRIASLSDATLASVAEYWSARSPKSNVDAVKALQLLRKLFARCAQPESILVDQTSLLERRIGLLKFYAHRHAAHISLQDYLFDILDLIHVVAAIVLIGAIIIDFDAPERASGYFDSVDEGGWAAAKAIFPELRGERVFKNWDIHEQAAIKWRNPYTDGVEYILNQLPSAIGYWDSRSS